MRNPVIQIARLLWKRLGMVGNSEQLFMLTTCTKIAHNRDAFLINRIYENFKCGNCDSMVFRECLL